MKRTAAFPLAAALAAALATPPVPAQESAAASSAERAAGLDAWRDAHGAAWRVHADDGSGYAELLYGGGAVADGAPRDEAGWFALARGRVEEAAALVGVDPATLTERAVVHLPLAQVGTTDKVTVSFDQDLGGVPVVDGRVNVLFDDAGTLLSVHATALRGRHELAPTPTLEARVASSLARDAFRAETGLDGAPAGAPRLVVVQHDAGGAVEPRLAWRVDVQWSAPDAEPEGWLYSLDAHTGAVLERLASVHHFDLTGTVSSMATPGTAPDTSSNPEVSRPLGRVRIATSQGTYFSNSDGTFAIVGLSSPTQATIEYWGSYANVNHSTGSDYSLTTTLQPGQQNDVLLNPSSNGNVTAQANAYIGIKELRDWIVGVVPGDGTPNFVAAANCNLNSTCNAFFNGGSVNFYRAGGGCVNTSYSTVVAHEMGHWLNVKYGTENGSDGMGEGNADVFAMYLYDTPTVGEGFCGTNCAVRNGWNSTFFCGDCCPNCHGGEVHKQGEVWMGAAWKIRDRLNTTNGDALGDAIADALFLGWMNSYNQKQIKSIIETQWLTLDDDDANLFNGSPHYDDIDGGFRDQGFPGVDLRPLTVLNVTSVPDVEQELGPYAVEADVGANLGQTITSADLHYRVNGGTWAVKPLTQQEGDVWTASIPIVPSPSSVDYYVTATDDIGGAESWPETAPAAVESFGVGAETTLLYESFDAGPAGWTHGSYGDTANGNSDWARGWPAGENGSIFGSLSWKDPDTAYSGGAVWGTDLGGGTDGAHGGNMHTWLRSPVLDCSGLQGTKLRFRRWASFHFSDFAAVRVNGVPLWSTDGVENVDDNGWVVQEFDLGFVADGSSSVQLEWELLSDGNENAGGWQIDDVEVLYRGPAVPGCGQVTVYGPGKVNSDGNVGQLLSLGEPVPGGSFQIRVYHAKPFKSAVLFSGAAPAELPYGGALRLVADPVVRESNLQLNHFGVGNFDVPVTAAMLGTTRYYQVFYRDGPHPDGTGVGLSEAMRVDFCP